MQPIFSSLGVPLGTILQDTTEANTEAPKKEGAPTSSLGNLLVPGLAIFAIFYFVLIRPEKKKQQTRKSMLGSIKKGTKVMTTSGMYGSVAQIKEEVITLQVADGVRLRFNRAAIQEVIDPTEESNKDGKDKQEGQAAVEERKQEKAEVS